jgi:type IV secretory pathway VirB4 component
VMTPDKKQKAASTQQFLPIEEIREGVVKMKNGSLRAVIIVSSVNFQLKSENEKDAMIGSYQSFLNSLNYPIQIMTQSRKTQLDDYLNKLKELEEQEANTLLKAQIEQYIGFVGGLIDEANVMAKRFYVIVPFFPSGVQQVEKGPIQKLLGSKQPVTDFETQKMELMQRVEQVISGLTAVGLRCVVLDTEELIELYYSVYNPDMTQSEKLANSADLESPIITGGDGHV